jgi:endoribonuclease Dicer
VFQLPISIAVTAFVFPAILSRFESYMIAQEACDHLGLRIPPDLALEAVTKDSDNTSEHRGEQIQYQRGMGKNYERLEFLGDCFLKMAVSIAVFVNRPGLTENWYHNYRMVLICNRNLFMTAVERELCQFIRSQSFERSAWYPEGLTLDGGRKLEPTTTHALAEKTIADVCEALIGAAILSYEGSPAPNDGVQSPCSRHDQPDRPDGQHQPQLSSIHNKEEYDRGGKFDMAVKAVTVLVNNKENEQESVHTNITCWGDYYQHYTLPEYQVAPSSHAQLDLAKQIQEKLGYRFNYPRLLRSAFVHPSYGYMMEKIPNYQLLEFLGDSLLDMVCVGFLYHRYPDKDPQWLTEHKV